jgi:hypothetical protein
MHERNKKFTQMMTGKSEGKRPLEDGKILLK